MPNEKSQLQLGGLYELTKSLNVSGKNSAGVFSANIDLQSGTRSTILSPPESWDQGAPTVKYYTIRTSPDNLTCKVPEGELEKNVRAVIDRKG